MVLYNCNDYKIKISVERWVIRFEVETNFNAWQAHITKIELRTNSYYEPISFLQNTQSFFLYLQSVGDEMCKLHYDKISLDNFPAAVRNKKLDIITKMSDE